MKMGSDADGTVENQSGRAKHENEDPTPLVPHENESGSAKHENDPRRPRYRRK
jgi:hypothetical protein